MDNPAQGISRSSG